MSSSAQPNTTKKQSHISQEMEIVALEIIKMAEQRKQKLKELKECVEKIKSQLNNSEIKTEPK